MGFQGKLYSAVVFSFTTFLLAVPVAQAATNCGTHANFTVWQTVENQTTTACAAPLAGTKSCYTNYSHICLNGTAVDTPLASACDTSACTTAAVKTTTTTATATTTTPVVTTPVTTTTAVAAACSGGHAVNSVWPTTVSVSAACPAGTTGTESCTDSYSNICYSGGVTNTTYLYRSCVTTACKAATTTTASTTTTTSTTTTSTTPATTTTSTTATTTPATTTTSTTTTVAPSISATVVYPQSIVVGYPGNTISVTPVLTGFTSTVKAQCKAAAGLPFGIVLNSSTCTIVGTIPSGTPAGQSYTINISSPGSTATAQLTLVTKVINWGANVHNLSTPYLENEDKYLAIAHDRGFKTLRVGFFLTADRPTAVADLQRLQAKAKAYGITLKPVLQTGFTWGDRTDAGQYPAGDANALYLQGYNRVYNFVMNFKDQINDWEFENELNLLTTVNGSPLYGAGWTAGEYNTTLMSDWSNVLRGMSDAIAKINTVNGLHLRRVIGTTSTMFGFLDYMATKGVAFDVISYHYYETLGVDPNNYWGGTKPSYNLFQKLGTYGKAVVFNEVNCAEIYKSTYENIAGKTVTEQCYASLNATLNYLRKQQYAQIEDVDVYEMLDEPAKTGAESHFGLLYNVTTPKVPLYMLSRLAGGTLSASESLELTNRGF